MPRLDDDGRAVTVDLHGCTVDEALRLAEAAVRPAAGRVRSHVRLIHGSSTSDPHVRNRTIKHVLRDAVEHGALRPWSGGALFAPNAVTLSLDVTARADPARLRLRDLWP